MLLLKYLQNKNFTKTCDDKTLNSRGFQYLMVLICCEHVNSPTAVEQAVTCAPVTQHAQVRSLVGTSILG